MKDDKKTTPSNCIAPQVKTHLLPVILKQPVSATDERVPLINLLRFSFQGLTDFDRSLRTMIKPDII